MPNWSSNKLEVTGDSLDDFRKTLVDDTFELEQIEKCPEFLNYMITPGDELYVNLDENGEIAPEGLMVLKELRNVSNANKYQTGLARHLGKPSKNYNGEKVVDALRLPLPNHVVEEITKKYGAKNWYDWNISHFGTKWNASGDVHDSGDRIEVWFDTAWSPPLEWLKRAAKKFPELKFEIHYSEGGMAFYGTSTAQGDVFEENTTESMYEDDVDWDDDEGEDEYYGCTEEYKEFAEKHQFNRGG